MSSSVYGPRYHSISVSREVFEVETRYTNLKAVGGGSYGIVCSAEDSVRLPLLNSIG